MARGVVGRRRGGHPAPPPAAGGHRRVSAGQHGRPGEAARAGGVRAGGGARRPDPARPRAKLARALPERGRPGHGGPGPGRPGPEDPGDPGRHRGAGFALADRGPRPGHVPAGAGAGGVRHAAALRRGRPADPARRWPRPAARAVAEPDLQPTRQPIGTGVLAGCDPAGGHAGPYSLDVPAGRPPGRGRLRDFRPARDGRAGHERRVRRRHRRVTADSGRAGRRRRPLHL